MLLYLINPFHLWSQADSQNNSFFPPHPHPEEQVSAWTILETQEKLLSEIRSCVCCNGGMSDIFPPEQQWEAIAGWRFFSLTNGTVTQRSYCVSRVFPASAKGQLQWTPACFPAPSPPPADTKQHLGKLS